MFSIGVYSVVNLDQYGFFTQNTYTPGAAIFIGVGALKVAFGVLGILVLFIQKKLLMVTVRAVVCFVSVSVFVFAVEPLNNGHTGEGGRSLVHAL